MVAEAEANASSQPEVILEVHDVPVHVGVLWPDAQAARDCGRGDIRLVFDRATGFIENAAFDASRVDYRLRYDNALHFSPTFQAFEDELAHRLVERYGIRGRHVIEIGTGSGRFLARVCELGDNRGTGFDPSHDPESADARVGGRVQVVSDYYGERYADRPADLVCCRHVLEHVPEPLALLRTLRRTLADHPESVVYFEVPNALPILEGDAIWDVIYEHCGYFVPESLGAMFRAAGFDVQDLHVTYEGQFIGVEARPTGDPDAPAATWDTQALAATAAAFGRRFAEKREAWRRRLGELAAAGERSVVWGGGAKAVSFLNLLEGGDAIEVVVDINPGKQGSHIAGTGQAIVPPEFLVDYAPDVAIVMNRVYQREIEKRLQDISPATRVICA